MKKNPGAGTRPARKRTAAKGPIDLKHRIETALRARFPRDTVDISDGYKGNVHVLVVSREFDGKSEYERQGMLRAAIEDALPAATQRNKVSLLLALSPAEIK